jgi:hypothetical protein
MQNVRVGSGTESPEHREESVPEMKEPVAVRVIRQLLSAELNGISYVPRNFPDWNL